MASFSSAVQQQVSDDKGKGRRKEKISQDVISRRSFTGTLGGLVAISADESVAKCSASIPVSGYHHIPVQAYSPDSADGIIFYLPGTASIAYCEAAIHAHASQMAAILNAHVIVIHPRLVPENKHPIPYNDTVQVINHLMSKGEAGLVDKQGCAIKFNALSIAISGYSSGGLLATQIYLNSLRDKTGSPFCQLIAIAPITDVNALHDISDSPASQQIYEEIFTRFPGDYLAAADSTSLAYHSPQYMAIPEENPQARVMLICGENDLLYIQNQLLYKKLALKGIKVSLQTMENYDHGLTWQTVKHLHLAKERVQKNWQRLAYKQLQRLNRRGLKGESKKKLPFISNLQWELRYGYRSRLFSTVEQVYPSKRQLIENLNQEVGISSLMSVFDFTQCSQFVLKYVGIFSGYYYGRRALDYLMRSEPRQIMLFFSENPSYRGQLIKCLINNPQLFKSLERCNIVLPITVHNLDGLVKTMSYGVSVLLSVCVDEGISEAIYEYLLGMSHGEFSRFLFLDERRDMTRHVSLDEMALLMAFCPESLKADLFSKLYFCKTSLVIKPFLKQNPEFKSLFHRGDLSESSGDEEPQVDRENRACSSSC